MVDNNHILIIQAYVSSS